MTWMTMMRTTMSWALMTRMTWMTSASAISPRPWSPTKPALSPPPAGPLPNRPAPKHSAGHSAQAASLPADADHPLPGARSGHSTRPLAGPLLRAPDRPQEPRTGHRQELPHRTRPRSPNTSFAPPGVATAVAVSLPSEATAHYGGTVLMQIANESNESRRWSGLAFSHRPGRRARRGRTARAGHL